MKLHDISLSSTELDDSKISQRQISTHR